MKISILPFKSIQAFADVETQEIFVSDSFLSTEAIENNIRHELAHIISQEPDHTPKYNEYLQLLEGELPKDKDIFRQLRRSLGIKPSIAANIGNISGIQNILVDYHLLTAYRKFSQKILGTEGHWEVINEGSSSVQGDTLSAKDQLIRLYPTPKGAFPVVVLYIPVVTHFRSPQARQLTYDMMLAEARIALGSARRKINGLPTPDGGSLNYDGSDLVGEGEKMKEEIIEKANQLGEPIGIWMY